MNTWQIGFVVRSGVSALVVAFLLGYAALFAEPKVFHPASLPYKAACRSAPPHEAGTFTDAIDEHPTILRPSNSGVVLAP
jgi:hypothetical protein